MIRPKQLLVSSTPSLPTPSPRIWVIGQFCVFILLQILATTIPPISCDNQQFTSTSLQKTNDIYKSPNNSSSSPTGLNPNIIIHDNNNQSSNNNNNNDKLLHRVARLTKVDYSMLSDETNNNKNKSSLPGGNRSNGGRLYPYNSAGYMASNGLRTLLKPQKFYTKQERFSSPDSKAGNLVSLNLVTEPRKDICNGHCQCEKKNAFTTVTCDYQRNPKVSEL